MTPPATPMERTDLAWQRTGLGLLSVGGLLGYRALSSGAAVLQVVAVVTGLFVLGILGVLAPLRYRLLERRRASGLGVGAPAAVAVVTAAVVVVALSAVAAILLPR